MTHETGQIGYSSELSLDEGMPTGVLCRENRARHFDRCLVHCISALYPGQPVKAPAADSASVLLVVESPFESLGDVVRMIVPGSRSGGRGRGRALTAAAQE